MRQALATPALVVAALVTGGCQIEARDTVVAGPNGSLADAVQAAHRRMHVRFTAALRIEQAIAHSDLARARAEAHALTELDEPAVLPAWRPYFEAIRDTGREIEAATGLPAAAQLTATLGLRCAHCHEAIGAHVAFPAEPPPPRDPRLATQMVHHQWAALQMWQGLFGPSDERWLAGAGALSTAPVHIVALSVTPESELDVDDVARIRLYAHRALNTGAQDARAELFGTMLVTCAHCHTVLRDR